MTFEISNDIFFVMYANGQDSISHFVIPSDHWKVSYFMDFTFATV